MTDQERIDRLTALADRAVRRAEEQARKGWHHSARYSAKQSLGYRCAAWELERRSADLVDA